MTPREAFLARLPMAPLVRADVLVVLCGEDSMPRALKALDLLVQGVAPLLLLSGGRDESAQTLEPKLFALGVLPSVILRDDASTNTHEQAENVIALARRHGWRKLALVASPYHLYRAYLTFLRSLLDVGMDEDVCLMAVPADRTRWSAPPEGHTLTRSVLLEHELDKIEAYGARGHVAGYTEALDYLDYWEGRS